MIDANSAFFHKRVLVVLSSDDSAECRDRRNQNFSKLLQLCNFDQIYNKNLAQSDSIH